MYYKVDPNNNTQRLADSGIVFEDVKFSQTDRHPPAPQFFNNQVSFDVSKKYNDVYHFMIADVRDVEIVFQTPKSKNPKEYWETVYKDLNWTCNCPAWTKRIKRECKHIDDYQSNTRGLEWIQ